MKYFNSLLATLGFILILNISCKNSEQSGYDAGIGLRVQTPMGTIDEEQSEGSFRLPYIGNKAVIPNLNDPELEFLILSEALDKNEFLQTFPIAVLRIKTNNHTQNVVISMPSDSNNDELRINNFLEFVSEYYFLKQNVENWYLNKNGLGKTELLSWEDEKFAMNLINRKLSNKG